MQFVHRRILLNYRALFASVSSVHSVAIISCRQARPPRLRYTGASNPG